MPSYLPIKRWMDPVERVRTAEGLQSLRQKLRAEVTERAGRDSLRIASWNLRDFDSNRHGHGPRLRESLYYIAEIISAFDLVVLQEVGRNLDPLEDVLGILGPEWDYIATDTIEGHEGHAERIVFLFRQSKLIYRKISGEIVLPQGNQTAGRGGAQTIAEKNGLLFHRAPFIAAFQAAGGFNFNLCVLHLRYDGLKAHDLAQHRTELETIGRFLRDRQDREREDYILLGDFGIGAPSELFADILEHNGFNVPEALTRRRSKLGSEHYYDQIAFRTVEDRLELAGSGVFSPFDAVFRNNDDDFNAYYDLMPAEKADDLWNGGPQGYYADQWRSWQMSDHMLLWTALQVDFSDHFIEQVRKSG